MSAETKWRKGPWFLEGNWGINRRKLGGWVSSFPPAGMPVFEMVPIVGEPEEIIANAHLIAAAPTLYEAALDAYNVFDGLANGNFKLNAASHKSAMKSLREAMAKARGEIP